MITAIKFRNYTNEFQEKMKKDIKMIKNDNRVIVKADKTSNLYKVQPEEYKKLLRDNITKSYETSSDKIIAEINDEAKEIATQLELDDRINIMPIKDAYITMKDHKENFNCKPKCRLINPTKSETGRISKKIIEQINKTIRNKTKFLQWTDTQEVIDWFNGLKDKRNLKFIKFDVVDFYPSIIKALLK